MFKKLLLAVLVIVVCAWATVWVFGTVEIRQQGTDEWPAGLGRLDDVPKRFPPAAQSAGATRFVQLASAAGVQDQALRHAVGNYTRVQFERSGDAIDAPPLVVAQYLAANAAALDAVRDHLLGGGPIVWQTRVTGGFDQPTPNLAGQMQLQRILMVRALDKARTNDPAAWNELRASWELDRGLWRRPDLISILVALAAARMQNAAARKMPLPVPAWYAETRSFDYTRAMAASQQAEAWTWAHYEPRTRMSLWHRVQHALRKPIDRYQIARSIEAMERSVGEIVRVGACDVESENFAAVRATLVPQGLWAYEAAPNVLGAWQRMLRFRAEREATDRALQIRAGQMPATDSGCSDGAWMVTANAVKFSREIKVPPPGIRYPLEYAR